MFVLSTLSRILLVRSLPALPLRNLIDDDREIVRLILDNYKDHSRILALVKDPGHTFQSFSFNEVTSRDL